MSPYPDPRPVLPTVTYDDGLGEITETYVPEPCGDCGIPLRSLDDQAFTPEGDLVCGRCHRIDVALRLARGILSDLQDALRKLADEFGSGR